MELSAVAGSINSSDGQALDLIFLGFSLNTEHLYHTDHSVHMYSINCQFYDGLKSPECNKIYFVTVNFNFRWLHQLLKSIFKCKYIFGFNSSAMLRAGPTD